MHGYMSRLGFDPVPELHNKCSQVLETKRYKLLKIAFRVLNRLPQPGLPKSHQIDHSQIEQNPGINRSVNIPLVKTGEYDGVQNANSIDFYSCGE